MFTTIADIKSALKRGALFWRRGAFALLIALLALGFVGVSTGPARASAPRSPSIPASRYWHLVSHPDPGQYSSAFYGVAVASASDVWAVGGYSNDNNTYQTLIEQWNGTSWNVVPSPNPGSILNVLTGVAVVSANDVWAVGFYANNSFPGPYLTLIEHWDGTSWSIVSSPNPGTSDDLNGVSVVSANDVWAVGYYDGNSLIEQWDGAQWSVVPSPSPRAYYNDLISVTAASASDVWAVGAGTDGNNRSTLVEHWDGSTWSVIPTPTPKYPLSIFNAAAAVLSHVWAVGSSGNSGNKLLAENWNGSNWSIVPISAGKNYAESLYGVTGAGGPSDVIAVGYYQNAPGVAPVPLIEKWNGSKWQVTFSSGQGYLSAVTWVAGTNHLWAVGYSSGINSGAGGALIYYYS